MTLFLALCFSSLILYTFLSKKTSHFYKEKLPQDWLIDSMNLFIQGTLVPVIQTYILYRLFKELMPSLNKSLDIPLLASFLINFIFIDYFYYWNHRLLHKKKTLPIHIVHHTATRMDVFATSRNTLWTSFFIIYIWINALFIFLLKDPTGYIAAATLTAALDCWRHSMAFNPRYQNLLSSKLGLITPIDHSWHHSMKLNFNFGANLNIFDRLHGTYLYQSDYPEQLGLRTKLGLFQKLFYPFEKER